MGINGTPELQYSLLPDAAMSMECLKSLKRDKLEPTLGDSIEISQALRKGEREVGGFGQIAMRKIFASYYKSVT